MANSSRVRLSILAVSVLETGIWLYLTLGGLNDSLPFARGYGEAVAFLSTVVFVPFVLPALVLAIIGKGLHVAAWLCSVGAILYLYDPLLRLTALDGVSFVALIIVGGIGVLSLAGYGAAQRHRATMAHARET